MLCRAYLNRSKLSTDQFGEATAGPAVQVQLKDARREEAKFAGQVGVTSTRLCLKWEVVHEAVRKGALCRNGTWRHVTHRAHIESERAERQQRVDELREHEG